ncbi:MAG: rhodanese-like domain-containing protein [Rhodobacterales bacterium]|nr:rhodanese-like domain-containing protein [Rhodobacterales bacterium]
MKIDANMITTIVIVALAFLAMKYLPRLTAGVPFVAPDVVKRRMDAGDDIVVLDVRTEGEFAGGHLPGAVNLPLGSLPVTLRDRAADLAELKGVPVYVHCRTENRSARAAKMLKKAGFTDLSVMMGGIVRWQKEKHPTV